MNFATAQRVLTDTGDPTSGSVSYTYDGKTVTIKTCTWWVNTTSSDLWFCFTNDGVTALWKKVTMV